MKKSVLMLTMLFMLAFASVCNAAVSNGKLLDDEEALASKFWSARNYSQFAAILDPEARKDFNEENFSAIRKKTEKDFGKVLDNELIQIEKRGKGIDVLIYLAKTEKVPEVLFMYVFRITNDKPLLITFNPQLPQKVEEAEK